MADGNALLLFLSHHPRNTHVAPLPIARHPETGLMRTLRGDSSIGVASSGIVGGTKVKPGAITVMSEIGIDISAYTSDDVRDFPRAQFDVVISCCGCGSKLDNDELRDWKEKPLLFEDWALDDPPAIDPGDLSEYRRVRDECREKVLKLIKFLEE